MPIRRFLSLCVCNHCFRQLSLPPCAITHRQPRLYGSGRNLFHQTLTLHARRDRDTRPTATPKPFKDEKNQKSTGSDAEGGPHDHRMFEMVFSGDASFAEGKKFVLYAVGVALFFLALIYAAEAKPGATAEFMAEHQRLALAAQKRPQSGKANGDLGLFLRANAKDGDEKTIASAAAYLRRAATIEPYNIIYVLAAADATVLVDGVGAAHEFLLSAFHKAINALTMSPSAQSWTPSPDGGGDPIDPYGPGYSADSAASEAYGSSSASYSMGPLIPPLKTPAESADQRPSAPPTAEFVALTAVAAARMATLAAATPAAPVDPGQTPASTEGPKAPSPLPTDLVRPTVEALDAALAQVSARATKSDIPLLGASLRLEKGLALLHNGSRNAAGFLEDVLHTSRVRSVIDDAHSKTRATQHGLLLNSSGEESAPNSPPAREGLLISGDQSRREPSMQAWAAPSGGARKFTNKVAEEFCEYSVVAACCTLGDRILEEDPRRAAAFYKDAYVLMRPNHPSLQYVRQRLQHIGDPDYSAAASA